jgi:hypothetical protein
LATDDEFSPKCPNCFWYKENKTDWGKYVLIAAPKINDYLLTETLSSKTRLLFSKEITVSFLHTLVIFK